MRGFGGMGGMMAQVQKLQQAFEKAQEEVANMTFEGEAANGLVKVEVTGKLLVKSVKIDPKAVDPDDVEMLEDLLVVALRDAQTRADETSKAILNKAVPLPPGMKLPF